MPKSTGILQALRRICLALPETSEVTTFGHPTFRAGKRTFSVLDEYHGERCIAFKAEPREQHALLEDSRFFLAPYGHGWLCLRVDAAGIDMDELRALMLLSYRQVALRRMLAALSGSSAKRAPRPKASRKRGAAQARGPRRAARVARRTALSSKRLG